MKNVFSNNFPRLHFIRFFVCLSAFELFFLFRVSYFKSIMTNFLFNFFPLLSQSNRVAMNGNVNTVKPVNNDHPRDPEIVAVVDRWSVFRGHLCNKNLKWDHKKCGCCRYYHELIWTYLIIWGFKNSLKCINFFCNW